VPDDYQQMAEAGGSAGLVCGRRVPARRRPFRQIHASLGGRQTAAFAAVGLERSIDRVRPSMPALAWLTASRAGYR
jgi:hypothetical protein